MNLPENDMRALLCIAPEAALKMASVSAIKLAGDALETADYAAFWALTKEKDLAEICSTVPDFEDQVSYLKLLLLQQDPPTYQYYDIILSLYNHIFSLDLFVWSLPTPLLPVSQIRRFICGTLAHSCRDLPRSFVEGCLSLNGRDLESFLKGSSNVSSVTNDRVHFSQNSFNTKTVHSYKYSTPDINRVLKATATT